MNLLVDDALLEGVVLEEVEELGFGEDESLERLLFFDDVLNQGFDCGKVVRRNIPSMGKRKPR